LLDKSVSLVEGDVLEQTDAVTHLCRALARVFPSLFSIVAKHRKVAQRTGLELLDEKELEEKIKGTSAWRKGNSPETKEAKRFLIEQLIARGYKREDIAAAFGVSVKTVYNALKVGA